MARPIKKGVDYFPLDVYIDKKFRLIEAKFGIIGFGVIIKIFQLIYANGYYYNWDEDAAIIIAAENTSQEYQLSFSTVQDIVDEAVRREIFDKSMFDKGILTSKGIQRRYLEITKKRSRVDVKKEYLLLSVPEIPVNVYINGVNVTINPEKVDDNTQSKVNKSKVNKSKGNESSIPTAVVPQNLIDFYQENISRNFITPFELDNIEFWCDKVDADVILWAMQQAVGHKKTNWKYIEGILKNHYNAGRTSLMAVQDAHKNFKAQKGQPSSIYSDDDFDYDGLEKIMQNKI